MARYSFVLQYFNFMGILGVKYHESRLEVSKFQIVLNHFKNIALFLSRNAVLKFMTQKKLPSNVKVYFSMFWRTVREYSLVQSYYQACITIFLQQTSARNNCNLINEMIDFRRKIEKRFPKSIHKFEAFELECVKHVKLFIIADLIHWIVQFIGYFSFYPLSWPNILAFVFNCIPRTNKLSCILFNYIVLRFVICAQEVLLLRVSESFNSYDGFHRLTNEVAVWQSELYSIKESFASKSSLATVNLLFFFVSRTVIQVRTH